MSQWSDSTRKQVQLIYGMGVGTFLIVAGVIFIPHVLEDGLTRDELILVGGVCIGGGLLAALPGLAMQYIGRGIEAWRNRKNGGGS